MVVTKVIKRFLVKDTFTLIFILVTILCAYFAYEAYRLGDYVMAMINGFLTGVNITTLLYQSLLRAVRDVSDQRQKVNQRHIRYLHEMLHTIATGDKEKADRITDEYKNELDNYLNNEGRKKNVK